MYCALSVQPGEIWSTRLAFPPAPLLCYRENKDAMSAILHLLLLSLMLLSLKFVSRHLTLRTLKNCAKIILLYSWLQLVVWHYSCFSLSLQLIRPKGPTSDHGRIRRGQKVKTPSHYCARRGRKKGTLDD